MKRFALRDEQARFLAIRAQFDARQERMRIGMIQIERSIAAQAALSAQFTALGERMRMTMTQLERSIAALPPTLS